METNCITSELIQKQDNTVFNPLVGDYRSADSTQTEIEKNESTQWPSISKREVGKNDIDFEGDDASLWPSISKRHDDDDDDDEDDGHVEKNLTMLWPSISGQTISENGGERFQKSVPIFPVEKANDEHIVCGIVYEPDTVDAQGDSASAEEIQRAAYDFMQNAQAFKVMHKGKAVNVKILESYVAPVDFTINKRTIKKGSWVLVTRILDKKLWQDIKAGKFTGYSMGGTAKVA